MFGTAQVNHRTKGKCGKAEINKMVKGIHDVELWQYKELPLVLSTCSDNNKVKLLSDSNSPIIIIPDGVERWIETSKVKQQNPVGIPVPLQEKEYSETYIWCKKEMVPS